MTTTKSNKCIPKGIYDQSKFTLSIKNPTLQEQCQQIFYFAASRCTDLISSHYNIKAEQLRQRKFRLTEEIKSIFSTEEQNTIFTDTQRKLDTLQSVNTATHQRKLKRDNLHTKCYIPWQDHNPKTSKIKRRYRKSLRKPRKRKPKYRRERDKIKNKEANTQNYPEESNVSPKTHPPPFINLPSKVLTNGHFGIFKKGPTFIPTPFKADQTEFLADIAKWENKLRWAYHHEFCKQSDPEHTEPDNEFNKNIDRAIIKSNVSYQAPVGKSPALELFIEAVRRDITWSKEFRIGDNLTKEERNALIDMKSWKDIEIRPFDKGKGFVLDYKSNYKKRMLEELNNTKIYEKISKEEQPHIVKNINDTIQTWTMDWFEKGQLSQKMATWLVNTDAKAGNIFQYYKAHKPEKDYPGRTIASLCGAPIERLSQWLEYHLAPITNELEWRLEDSNHILKELIELNKELEEQGKTADNIIHVSWDIVAMFPNISNERGMAACKERLEERDTDYPSTECIMEALDISLTNNISQFDDEVYRQTSGTAMGPSHSCSYGDNAVDQIIDRVVMSARNPFREFLLIWKRLRDDIYSPWTGSLEDLLEFDKWLNTLDPNFKFTMKFSTEGVEFLDIFIYTKNHRIETKIYSKECDPHSYLLPTSCHPAHICKNIPKSVLTRVKKCCSEPEEYEKAKKEYIGYLRDRNYSKVLIDEAAQAVDKMDREKLIYKSVDKPQKGRSFPLVYKYNPKLPNMGNSINKHKHILSLSPDTSQLFPSSSIFVSFKVENNINRQLTSSKFKPNQTEVQTPQNNLGCISCESCKLCQDFLVPSEYAKSYHTQEKFKIKSTIMCNTKNVIYIVNDKVCKKSYIGYTSDSFKIRWSNHKSHIKKNHKSCELSKHFINNPRIHPLDTTSQANYDRSLTNHLEVILIESVVLPENCRKAQSIPILEARETYWQNTLKAVRIYGGLNKRNNKKK